MQQGYHCQCYKRKQQKRMGKNISGVSKISFTVPPPYNNLRTGRKPHNQYHKIKIIHAAHPNGTNSGFSQAANKCGINYIVDIFRQPANQNWISNLPDTLVCYFPYIQQTFFQKKILFIKCTIGFEGAKLGFSN